MGLLEGYPHKYELYSSDGMRAFSVIPLADDVNFNTRTGKAFFRSKGMVDFVGISNGTMIAFDAKNTI